MSRPSATTTTGRAGVRPVPTLLGLAVGAVLAAGLVAGAGTARAQEQPTPTISPTAVVPATGTDGRAPTDPGARDAFVPADASGGGGARLVALGDSWAAGTAAGTMVDPTSGACRRTVDAYPALLAPSWVQAAWTSRACASDRGAADGQFAALTRETEAVTVTVGGDATGLGALARACGAAGDAGACTAAGATFDRAAAAIPAALDTSLAAIRTRAPRARVVVTGLPLVTEGRTCAVGALDPARARRVDDAVTRLDAALADRSRAAGMVFADVRTAFRDHGVCAVDPWLTPLVGADPQLAGGPTRTGHGTGFRPAVDAALGAGAFLPAAPDARSAPDVRSAPSTTPGGRTTGELLRPLFAG